MFCINKVVVVRTANQALLAMLAVLVLVQMSAAARPQAQAQQPGRAATGSQAGAQPRAGQPQAGQAQGVQPKAAQPKAAQPAPATRKPAPGGAQKLPEPKEISGSQLQTGDGVMLSATYFPGTKEKETVPVLLLHNWKSSRKEFGALAIELQKRGCAVLVPDLRGHGASTSQYFAARGGAREEKLDPTKFRANDYAAMAVHDMAALRKFLVKENNDGRLNLNKLSIVGSEMGAAIGMVWAAFDWAVPNYEHAGIKQGQDVKALILISPRWSYSGLDTASILNARGISPVRDRVSVMFLVGGQDAKKLRDVERLEARFVLNRPQPEALAERTVLLAPPFPTDMQAEKLLTYARFNLPAFICKFIEDRVVNGEPDAVWMEHR